MPGHRGTCRHCERECTLRPRRLCGRCFSLLEVRHKYPVTPSKDGGPATRGAKRGVTYRPGATPAEPTDAMPGTEAKVLVMIRRAELGQPIFHPLDGKRDAEPTPTTEQEEEEIEW